jgi:hypothetical protein
MSTTAARVATGTVRPPWWDRVLIVGGGPSAYLYPYRKDKSFDRILAVNDGWDHVPWADCVCSIDPDWSKRNRLKLQFVNCERYLALDPEIDGGWGIPGVTYLRHSPEDGLSRDLGALAGGNSGHAAINLAVLKGTKHITLIGFDMHEPERVVWREKFHVLASQLDGVTVVNANPRSAIDAFPKVTN